MVCNIYDATLTRIGALDQYISLVWTEEYRDKGKFQLVAVKNDVTLTLMQIGRFAGIAKSDTLMYIYSVQDENNQLWAYGFEAKYLLDDRIYAGTLKCANVESTLRAAFTASRPFAFMGLAEPRGLPATLESQYSYRSIFEISQAWCEAAGYGFTMRFDRASKMLLFDVYAGQARPTVKFSSIYGNLYDFSRVLSESGWKTVACVAGGGEGADRVYVTAGATDATGLARRELFVDARDIQREELTTEQYEALLVARGEDKLAAANATDKITFAVTADDYGIRYGLGDTIMCVMPEYNARLSIDVYGVTRTYEDNTEKLELILGTPVIGGIN